MGVIRRCVENPVPSNMVMIVILVGGSLLVAPRIPREVFPEFDLDMVSITVPYPGASPADIERSICQKIEEQLTGLEGVDEISAESREGFGTVVLKLYESADVRKVLDEAKSEVDKIEFPEDAEDPIVTEVTLKRHVIHVAVAGHVPERTLKAYADEIRDEINDLGAVSQVSVSGVREYEIVIEVREQALRRYGLTHGDISRAIRQSSFDLPAGRIKTAGGEMTIRAVGERLWAREYRNIPVLYKPDGQTVLLGQVATVREGFEDTDIGGLFNGEPAALVSVFKTPSEDTVEISQAVRDYVRQKRPELPEGLTIETWSDGSRLVQDRLTLLLRNGVMGLALVVLVLWFFLRLRLSLWVAMGIPVSVLGTIMVLYLTGDTLNMMSMFALIMALGLIVDDAIVVGENVYARVEGGESPLTAAVEGTREVAMPVLGAVMTTWLAFLPLMLIPGLMGRFIKILPVTVILALAFSLVECLLILPPHLAHWLRPRDPSDAPKSAGFMSRIRTRADAGIRGFIQGPFAWLYDRASTYRYVTLAAVLSICIVVVGAVAGGRVKIIGFPDTDSDVLQTAVILPAGTPRERTAEVAAYITRAAKRMNEQVRSESGEPVVQRVYSLIGQQSGAEGDSGSNVAEVIVELLPSERRGLEYSSRKLTELWRTNTGPIPQALSLTFGSFRPGPRGKALEVRLLGPATDAIKPLAERLKDKLATYDGVFDIQDDALPGNIEVKVTRKLGAENIGGVFDVVARQLRDAFYGSESLKIQRGRHEVEVRVRYPEPQRRSLSDLENMRIRIPGSTAQVPLSQLVNLRLDRGYSTLRRVSGKSVITVSADVDEDRANSEEILRDLRESGFFAELISSVPGTRMDLRGQRQQIFESLDALLVWFPVCLLGVYTVLAGIFRSYIQPVIIMIAIPFGLVGALIGHYLMGFDVTLLSLFGMVALTGIVVNDSLVLIDLLNRKVRDGVPLPQAAREASLQRFRPIILTTVTTVAGMGPMLLERSFQAQFLKPMVVSIAFGLMFATTLTLLVVPSLVLIGSDLRRILHWLFVGDLPPSAD